jgi:hypothetical protein
MLRQDDRRVFRTQPVIEQHHAALRIMLAGDPEQPVDGGKLRMDRFRPQPRVLVLVSFGVDEVRA